jgi:1,3-beta-glucanosyltransferase GAS3
MLTASIALFLQFAAALNTIEMKGQEFVDSKTNERFVILGIDYQIGGQAGLKPQTKQDPLTNGTVCLRDAALLQSLGINTVRVYNLEPTFDHDECMSYFNTAGIYLILDVNTPFPGENLDRTDPKGTYTANYLNHIFQVVEAFKNYPNVLGFFAANEVINEESNAQDTPPYIRVSEIATSSSSMKDSDHYFHRLSREI